MSKTYKKRIGDRHDGRRIRSLDPMSYVGTVIMRRRNDAVNYFEFKVDMAPIKTYLHKKRTEEGMHGLGFVHVLTAAFVRMISQNPAMNRYIAGSRIYQRDDIVFSMMIKKEMSAEGQETGIKLKFEPEDTIDDVFRKMNDAVAAARAEGDSTALDKVARMIVKMPTLILRAFVDLNIMLDDFGIMPRFIEEASPFHASFFLTDLGSLGIPAVYHHIYNFGNVTTFLAFGRQESEYTLDREGNAVKKDFIRCKISVDERISDGFAMAQSFKYLLRLLSHPEMLDAAPEKVYEDID